MHARSWMDVYLKESAEGVIACTNVGIADLVGSFYYNKHRALIPRVLFPKTSMRLPGIV